MRFRASDVATATRGTLVGEQVGVDGVSFDSRTLRPGNLFVPLVAERNGHQFIAEAAQAGAAATLTSEGSAAARAAGIPAIEVADTAEGLIALATWGARRLDAVVVGITGSVGKTTTKDLAAAAIGAGRGVSANERSYNNEQGLPVTVLGAPDGVEVLVLEMGMRGFGEISRLCTVAPPTIGIVTAVAAAHTARLGGIEGVARAKAELVRALPEHGLAILNADDERVRSMRRLSAAPVLTFGEAADADVVVDAITLDELARPSLRVHTPWGSAEVRLQASGRHLVHNVAAAIAAAGALEVDVEAAASAVAGATLSASRMAVHRLPSGAVVIDDAYNANPTSMTAALDALVAIPARRHLAVVGLMAELDDAEAAHRTIAARAIDDGIELIAVGTDLYGVAPCADPIAAVGPLGQGTAVLVKASRVAGLDRIAAQLAAASPAVEPGGDEPLP